jgi:hypothetical protein
VRLSSPETPSPPATIAGTFRFRLYIKAIFKHIEPEQRLQGFPGDGADAVRA